MACGISFEATTTSTVLFLLVLLQAALVWEEVRAAPAKRSDILAGTEFLSVFINGAMAPTPQRRRGGYRRGNGNGNGNGNGTHRQQPTGAAAADSATAESHQHEASIYRISRNPNGRPITAKAAGGGNARDDVVRFYPISQRTLENRQQNLASLIDDLSTAGQISSTNLSSRGSAASSSTMTSSNVTAKGEAGPSEKSLTFSRSNGTGSDGGSRTVARQKVIGVSVTSTVEATPYKVRVEHYDADDSVVTRPPLVSSSSRDYSRSGPTRTSGPSILNSTNGSNGSNVNNNGSIGRNSSTTTTTTTTTSTTTSMTLLPAQLVTEELNDIVSESNRSEFTVDEGPPRTSWQGPGSVTPRPTMKRTPADTFVDGRPGDETSNESPSDPVSLPAEVNYEVSEENSETHEYHEEPIEINSERLHPQGRKVGRHYDASHYNRPGPKVYSQSSKGYKPSHNYGEPAKVYGEPAKVYGEPERVYGEPAKVYSEPAKVYSEPAKVYGEPAKIYGEPAKVYGEPEKIYSEPSKVYSEPAKIYSEPAKVYSQPAKIYGEPSKIYDSVGQPIGRVHDGEPDEQNYEVDESVSVGSNGNAHGPQLVVTEPPSTSEVEDGHKIGYVVEGRNYRKYRVEERTPDGFIVGEYGVVSHDDGSLRGVRYTADGTINPRLIYDALMKFLAL